MSIVEKSTSRIFKKETRPLSERKRPRGCEELSPSPPSSSSSSSSVCDGDQSPSLNSLAIASHKLHRLRVPRPPTDSQKLKPLTHVFVRKIRPPDDVSRMVTVNVARPLPLEDAPPHKFEYSGPGGPRFDSDGMLLPHSLLGNLEDFRTEMQLRGETELAERIPDTHKQPPLVEQTESAHPEVSSETEWSQQSHALQHWSRHMAERRRQQDFIARLLQKPASSLLMNRSSRFRHVQEQRELIDRALSARHLQHGRRVGSEFWSLPQRYGDELRDVLSERGNTGWDQSVYLHERRAELKDVLAHFSPDAEFLEVLGSAPHGPRSPQLEDQEEEELKENLDPLAQFDDIIRAVDLIPALRVCGEVARWSGSDSSHQGEEGVSVRVNFETLTGRSVNADLELANEGSTVIYYSWQRETDTLSHSQLFYFNSSSGMILPSSTKRIRVTFKSATARITTEVWRLITHPVLMGGASLHVILRGVALDQDENAAHRAALELYLTDEERFHICNPQLQYQREPVEALRSLWQQVRVSGDHSPEWDLSLNTLSQALLGSPSQDELHEAHLLMFNSLVLQLQRTQPPLAPELRAQRISLQLWRELLEALVQESVRLRHTLKLPEHLTWTDALQENIREEEQAQEDPGAAPEERGSSTKQQAEERKTVEHMQISYRRLLHKQVYALMERMVDSLCELLEDCSSNSPETSS
ncbi:hypothetical protein DNTS_017219 [Danionella cerebrum]|uniref:Mycbp-associated protein n=1 Tax=Danionella cerebrum TaxID=2873325 RepID=A0A553QBP3_9TELE|nr:hypothetical protein DNTS_017219 [Danionella translucida]